jgi:iron complex transport system permease protein
MLVGGDNACVLPGSALAGAVFLIGADAAARVVLAPEDLPIGVVTGLCGGLFFIWLMARRR